MNTSSNNDDNDNNNNNNNNNNTNNRSIIMSNHQQPPRPPSQNKKQETKTTLELVIADESRKKDEIIQSLQNENKYNINNNNNSWKVKAENAMVEIERLQAELATATTANANAAANAATNAATNAVITYKLAEANRRINELELEKYPPNFGNIEEKFPGFLLKMLEYISDRTVYVSVASSNKKIYEISKGKKYQPPWPRNFLLKSNLRYEEDDRFSHLMCDHPVWSPDGTQIACIYKGRNIVIFDQRYGQLRLRLRRDDDEDLNVENGNANGNDEIHWLAHNSHVNQLKFSPDGKFLVSASNEDASVRIWDYNSTDGYGYYQKLQEWNIELPAEQCFDISPSPCCRYVVVLSHMRVLLKDIENNGKTIKSILLPENEQGLQVLFSNKDGHHSIFIRSWDRRNKKYYIKIWRPYDYFYDEDGRIGTKLKSIQTGYCDVCNDWFNNFCLSRDRSMIAIITRGRDSSNCKVTIYSYTTKIESTENILVLKRTFDASPGPILFTPDDKYIVYINDYSLAFMEISTGRDMTKNMNYSFNNMCAYISFLSFSPVGNGQRLIVGGHSYATWHDGVVVC